MPSSPYTIIRIADVCALTGYGRTSIFNKANPSSPQFDPTFPKNISLSPSGKGAVGWLLAEVEEWIKSRAQAR